jgi:hypothetical protein
MSEIAASSPQKPTGKESEERLPTVDSIYDGTGEKLNVTCIKV